MNELHLKLQEADRVLTGFLRLPDKTFLLQFWMTVRPLVEVVRLGLVPYKEGLRLQQVYVNRHRSAPAHALLLCQHSPVYTTGIRHKPYPGPLLDQLRLLGADVHRTNRGGLITFHGPGQLVCYPVLNLGSFKKVRPEQTEISEVCGFGVKYVLFLQSVRWYVSQLEKTIITLCGRFGVEAASSPHTGVWVGDKKICAVGIHCGHYVTSHGLALNCNPDLSWFGHIVPCGIEGKGVTSLSRELQRDVSVQETIPHLLDAFREQFNCQLTEGETPEPEQNFGVSSA
ncbi:hypothetical protein CHARACLAT_010765 [Characodon lateralis]|uniref:lipoyl(octanoyl) transferase n=1 Tax=Characodon lateralis TaxID=208331 RepID=A0ABU7F1W6_9TELE|nr:hypothetical protein [Characodon lateralis]